MLGHTFGLIMCARYFKQAKDTSHSSKASIGIGVLQTGHCTLQNVQHAFVNLPVHLLERKGKEKVFESSLLQT